tara:strand:- start:4523 stop:6229 length:1707 start_codon:yes stop_codon:yes gene_type:complete
MSTISQWSSLRRGAALAAALMTTSVLFEARTEPIRSRKAMVVSQDEIASEVGVAIMRKGGNAIDAAVATALTLAVTYPTAGNIGGGGFLLYRPATGDPVAYDFREMAPGLASSTMFLQDGQYDPVVHHRSHVAVGVPGTVAGLYLAWTEHGSLSWRELVEPGIRLAREGFRVSEALASSLAGVLPSMAPYPASMSQFSKQGIPYQAGEILRQSDLARTLERIAEQGPSGFYDGETADLIVREMVANGGLITYDDLLAYRVQRRSPLVGRYRGNEILSVPPVSSGGIAVIEMLNILEGYDLASSGSGSAETIHLLIEAMRRAYADRARHLGDPTFNPSMPIERLISKDYARGLQGTINLERASTSSPQSFVWPSEGTETTHLSVVDQGRNAVSLTYTLEQSYGAKITIPGGGFLLNNEMGDFNAAPGLTTETGLIGTLPNLAEPGKRMLSSMTPTIVARDGRLLLVTGSPGGRTIINTVLMTILNVVDFGMNVQEAVDAPRIHHQWLPDQTRYERWGVSPDTLELLEQRGHIMVETGVQGAVSAIYYDSKEDLLEGAEDRRRTSAAVGF